MAHSRREFLRRSACGLTAAALASSIRDFGLVNAFAQSQPSAAGYKALVCIFLNGGNDGNNAVIPYDDYNAAGGYSAVRGTSQLAVPQSALLQITPSSLGGRKFGFHPNLSPEVANPLTNGQPTMEGLLPLWNQGKVAVLCNVGTLVQPLTRAIYQSGQGRPYQLFSHSDQVTQQQSSVSTSPSLTGWGGRISDAMLGVNGAAPLPMMISIAGSPLFAKGLLSRQLTIGDSNTPLSRVLVLDSAPGATGSETTARRNAYDQIRSADLGALLIKASSDSTAQALQTSAALSTNPTIAQPFPNNGLARQLLQVARLISLRNTLGASRQIFFCSIGGFDTHTNQTGSNPANPAAGGANSGSQGSLLTQISQAMNAFYKATVELGVQNDVTTFTISDFGRTFQPSGTGAAAVGSDHGWGNHQLIMGGSVKGQDFYGTFPVLALGGPDDTDNRGRWIPTTSIDQYAATLATWYGMASADLPTVFPFLSRFPTSNLGFLS